MTIGSAQVKIHLVGLLGNVRACLSGRFLSSPSPQRPISWQPDVLAPVFYGYREYEAVFVPPVAELKAPGAVVGSARPSHPCIVFFPTLDGSPESAAILSPVGGFPLIVFVHGECKEPAHYKKWFRLCAQLARCGYVVVAPELPEIIMGAEAPEAPGDLALLWELIEWMRTSWEHHQTLMPAPFTGVVGHSHGGGLAAQLVTSNPGAFKALASLSGVAGASVPHAIYSASVPKLFMWGTNDAPQLALDPAPGSEEWAKGLDPKHSAIFNDMAHWDYLEPGTTSCDGKRGPCTLTPSLATETLMMFFGRYLTPEGAPDLRPRIASNLRPPSVKDFTHALSVEQEFYAGAFLDDSFENIGSNRGCGVQLTWEISANDLGTTNYGAAPNT